MNKAIFIDKDGTLIDDIPYNVDIGLVHLQDGVLACLEKFQQNGFLLFIVSNQSGIAKGYFKEEDVEAVFEKIRQLLQAGNIKIEACYYCPHDGYESIKCECRKPQPGMLLQAASSFDIDLSESWMIGDILHDVEAGNRAGCKTILLDNGNETEWEKGDFRNPDFTVRSWYEMHDLIAENE